MAVPKRRTPRARRDMRRAHHDKVVPINLIPCPNCYEMMVPHRVCQACGHYNGRLVVKKQENEKEKE